jgi:hypothetical protein
VARYERRTEGVSDATTTQTPTVLDTVSPLYNLRRYRMGWYTRQIRIQVRGVLIGWVHTPLALTPARNDSPRQRGFLFAYRSDMDDD